ncbi:uncharacterized protein LOC129582457 [Paramacrobiotus metropolitanus]|uniref:uncharacterized protein LOC129582457 n=1 Tax=Paramacrobiotus metropolitanus TaxID=2943436 RepID=UPI0024465C00|nr:uncharacterized protein LOC129582457 [Paramacrobiotus metropolitanus]
MYFIVLLAVCCVALPGHGSAETAKVTGDKSAPCRQSMAFGWGDAVDERWRCSADPAGKPINPTAMRLLSSTIANAGRFIRVRARSDDAPLNASRAGRRLDSEALDISSALVRSLQRHNGEPQPRALGRDDTSVCNVAGCAASGRLLPESCCPVRTEVAYPQFGQSAITEDTFTIIQDFPDFVQPVFKRVCVRSQCNLIYGNCTQKYVPHAVFSAPSGKFGSLFGQDYLLVESGCECVPANPFPDDPANRLAVAGTPPAGVDVSAVNDKRNSVA